MKVFISNSQKDREGAQRKMETGSDLECAPLPADHVEPLAEYLHSINRRQPTDHPSASAHRSALVKCASVRLPYQMRPGSRVVTSWTNHALPSGSLKAQNDP